MDQRDTDYVRPLLTLTRCLRYTLSNNFHLCARRAKSAGPHDINHGMFLILRDSNRKLILQIEHFCDKHDIAETTFGRLAVNDGKFVGRVRNGSKVSDRLLSRVAVFVESVSDGSRVIVGRSRRRHEVARTETIKQISEQQSIASPPRSAGYHEEREKRMVFTNSCNEKWVIADRALQATNDIKVSQPGFRIFESNLGEGRTLARLLRGLHKTHPTIPFLVVAKKHGLDDLRVSMGNMIDRFLEHPMTVLVITNMYFREAVSFFAQSMPVAMSINWKEVALEGTTGFDFQNQISALHEDFSEDWSVIRGDSGQVEYERPNVLMIYRQDHRFLLNEIIPKPGYHAPQYDFILASHAYRHAAEYAIKIERVLLPLSTNLAPGGKMLVIQSHDQNPAREILDEFWSRKEVPIESRERLIQSLKKMLSTNRGDYRFSGITDNKSLFRYDMHSLPRDPHEHIGTAALQNAWDNAVYVGQVPHNLVDKIVRDPTKRYIDVTRDVIEKNQGLWFTNESFVVTRNA